MNSNGKNSNDLLDYLSDGEESEKIPDAEIFTHDFMDQIKEAKRNNASEFQSYWEADESDIQSWTKKEIRDDPTKKFIHSAEMGRLDDMKELINQIKSNKETTGDKKRTEMIQLLSSKDSDGYTALHRACYSNMLSIVKYLVEIESEISDSDDNEQSSSSFSSQLEARTEMGWTPLHSAVYWNSYECVEYLLKYAGADPNARSNSGQTSLHLAASQAAGPESILLLLTNVRTLYDIRNDQNETAYDIAKRSCKYNALFEITDDNLNRL